MRCNKALLDSCKLKVDKMLLSSNNYVKNTRRLKLNYQSKANIK